MNVVKSQISSLESSKQSSGVSRSVSNVRSVDPTSLTAIKNVSIESDTHANSSAKDTSSFIHKPLPNHCDRDRDLQRLRREIEALHNEAQSIENENERLRGLIASQQTKPADMFRRAITMILVPKDVTNAIGVHKGNDAIILALEATLFNFDSLPIQKVSTSFSDGHWQEEMTFILDTDCRWMEGRIDLHLKQKMFLASHDPIIATASISSHHFSFWLHEGGEHSVQVQMERKFSAPEAESTRTMLSFSVKVGTQRFYDHTMKTNTSLASVDHMHFNERVPTEMHLSIRNEDEHTLEFSKFSGKSNESGLISLGSEILDDCCSNVLLLRISNEKCKQTVSHEKENTNVDIVSNRVSPIARQKGNSLKIASSILAASLSVSTATSTDDDEAITSDFGNLKPRTVTNRLTLNPTFKSFRARKKVKPTTARISLAPMPNASSQRTSHNSKEESFQSVVESDSKITLGTSMPVLDVDEDPSTKLEDPSSHSEAPVDFQTDTTTTDFVTTIKGVSFANHRLLAIIRKNRHSKSNLSTGTVLASQNSDSSGLCLEPLQSLSGKPEPAAENQAQAVELNADFGCWSRVCSSLALCYEGVHMMLARFSGQFRRKKRLAAVQPVCDVLESDSDIEPLALSEQRRNHIQASKSQSKMFMEDSDTIDNDSVPPSDIVTKQEQNVYDAVEAKLIFALSQLKNAYFNLPKRAVKIAPILNIMEFMKTLPLGKSSPLQRFTGIQHFLQSKWIDSDSMFQIMTWIKNPPEEVKFFECMAMRVVDKQGLMMIARRFVYAHGTKFVALKMVERLLDLSNKDTRARDERRASHFRHVTLPSNSAEQDLSGSDSDDL